ncbi:MAG TPA: ComEC/Rec2 family competence protein [Acidimicrobiia bacterium]|nr:ComEC/Rec2 family competence protein [Acidimicrobiia bacterium]
MTAGPVVALVAVLAGILAGERGFVPGAQSIVVLGIATLVAAWFTNDALRVVLTAAALALLGGVMMTRALDGQRVSSLNADIAGRAERTVHGTLTSDPASARFTVSVLLRANLPGGHHRTLVATADTLHASDLRVLQAGDVVTLTGRFAPLGRTPPDERARWKHAVARLEDARVDGLRSATTVNATANQLRAIILRGTRPLGAGQRALLAGFLLGDTRAIPADIDAAYRDAGLAHLLAVSGENVAFVLALIAPILRRLSLGARTSVAFGAVGLFAVMTRFEPSVLRASFMAAIAMLAVLAGRPTHRLRVLVYAALALLLVDPFLVHSVGFWLSCCASAGIALFEPAIVSRLPLPRGLAEPLAVSLAAQVGVMPVLLLEFGSFPLVTPLTNLAAAPAAALIGVYGLIASVTSGVVPPLGPVLQQPTSLLIGWVTAVARLGAAVTPTLDQRGALAVLAVIAFSASLACLRARRTVPVAPPR